MDTIGKLPYPEMTIGDRVYIRGGDGRCWTIMEMSNDGSRALIKRNIQELSAPTLHLETEGERSGQLAEELKDMKRELDALGS